MNQHGQGAADLRAGAAQRPELTVVMPAYNEEGAIAQVVDEWVGELDHLGIDYRLVVYDDGSRDATPDLLERLSRKHPRLDVRRHDNRGHGPTILRGYREAEGEWVLQVDADGEMPAAAFERLWDQRDGHDLVMGYRSDREGGLARRIITAVARSCVRLLFGSGVHDVNTPYRLLRRDRLREIVETLPDDTFAPNVILSGIAARRGLSIEQFPVHYRGRVAGTPSLVRWSLWKGAARAFRQTLRAAFREAFGR